MRAKSFYLHACCAILFLLMLASCASKISKTTVVLDYDDFGPQAMAYSLIGRKQVPWDPSLPVGYDDAHIKVVVYRGIKLDEVQEHYPANKASNIDYRYLSHTDALNYFDQKIRQNLISHVTEKMKLARAKIQQLQQDD